MGRTIGGSVVLALALGCGGGGGGGGSGGALSVGLTDSAAGEFDHVIVTLLKIRVHRADAVDEAGWHELDLGPGGIAVDLLTLQNGVMLPLGQISLPSGDYDQLRLMIDPARCWVTPTGGEDEPLLVPSGLQTGLKILHDFHISDGVLELVIDFDASRSVVRLGHGGFLLKPVLDAFDLGESGMIDGVVAVPGATVVAAVDEHIVKVVRPAPNGAFALWPLPAGRYFVSVTAPGYAPGIVANVGVAAGGATHLGSINLQVAVDARIEGTIDPTGATVTLLQELGISGRIPLASATPDASDGDFEFIVSTGAAWVVDWVYGTVAFADPYAGDYVLTASAEGYVERTVAGIHVAPDADPVIRLVPVGTAGSVAGTFTVSGFYDGVKAIVTVTSGGVLRNSARVEIDGPGVYAYVVGNLPLGAVTVEVHADGLDAFPAAAEFALTETAPDAAGIDFHLRP
jgi:hypothetical protein